MTLFIGDLNLRDAIALDYYLDNVSFFMKDSSNEDQISEHLKLLAAGSYCVADIFCETKEAANTENKTTDKEDV